MEIQAVLFDITKWNTKAAKKWLAQHKLVPMKRVHKTDLFLRYRIHDPKKYSGFATKKLPNSDIVVILGKPS